MKTFKDLEFKQHPNGLDGLQARMDFPNGYGISVIRLKSPFGDRPYVSFTNDETEWEVAVMRNGEPVYDTPITDDVLGYQKEDDVTEIMRKIQELKMAKDLEQKIRARLKFGFNEPSKEAWSRLKGKHETEPIQRFVRAEWFEAGARWQHAKLVDELAPLLAELSDALDVALRQWCGLSSYTEDTDLETADNPEAELFREKKAVLKKLEAWLGKGIK